MVFPCFFHVSNDHFLPYPILSLPFGEVLSCSRCSNTAIGHGPSSLNVFSECSRAAGNPAENRDHEPQKHTHRMAATAAATVTATGSGVASRRQVPGLTCEFCQLIVTPEADG